MKTYIIQKTTNGGDVTFTPVMKYFDRKMFNDYIDRAPVGTVLFFVTFYKKETGKSFVLLEQAQAQIDSWITGVEKEKRDKWALKIKSTKKIKYP